MPAVTKHFTWGAVTINVVINQQPTGPKEAVAQLRDRRTLLLAEAERLGLVADGIAENFVD